MSWAGTPSLLLLGQVLHPLTCLHPSPSRTPGWGAQLRPRISSCPARGLVPAPRRARRSPAARRVSGLERLVHHERPRLVASRGTAPCNPASCMRTASPNSRHGHVFGGKRRQEPSSTGVCGTAAEGSFLDAKCRRRHVREERGAKKRLSSCRGFFPFQPL